MTNPRKWLFYQANKFEDYAPPNFKIETRLSGLNHFDEPTKCLLRQCGDVSHDICVRKVTKAAFQEPISEINDLVELLDRLPKEKFK